MTEEQSSRVLGGQAQVKGCFTSYMSSAESALLQVWAEQTDDTNIEDTLWPRAGALSEVFWTGQAESRNASEALQRLHGNSLLLI